MVGTFEDAEKKARRLEGKDGAEAQAGTGPARADGDQTDS